MKKLSMILIAALLITILAGCSIQHSVDGIQEEAEKLPIIEVVQVLADNDENAFLAYMHPSVSKDAAHNGFVYMADYLYAAAPVSLECLSTNIYAGIGAGGKSRTITSSYLVHLDKGSILVDAVYVEDSDGSGFTQFLCKIGVAQ
ncbi:MAG: hypothetical protein CW335_01615 [Clostridiales bacterium]|nr:hypothetical protein [Clostridiales bacterium]